MGQNIFDNEKFFINYKELREQEDNYNELLEQPSMMALLPDLKNKSVLDLGCGFGINCTDFINRGASEVTGIDISKKMLQVAANNAKDKNIEYINMNMEDLTKLPGQFDMIYSSLAFHYIDDFTKLMRDCYTKLNEGGYLLFSQEHPIVTSTIDGKGHFNLDDDGNYLSYTFSNYNQSGRREISWFVDGIIKYHRTMGEIITILAEAGFILESLVEPVPAEWAVSKLPAIKKELIKPNFMLVKARK